MDNATNNVVAGNMIEKEWPTIFFTRCTCHCIDLLFEDIAKCAWIDIVLRSALKIIVFITRKQYILAIFRTLSKKDLVKPSTTRFAYSFILLSNLVDDKVYGGLRRMFVSDQWCKWKGSKTKKAEEVVSIVFYANFWSNVKMIMTICKPILKVLRLADREGATMGLIYEVTQTMMKEINNMRGIDPLMLEEIKNCCLNRCSMFLTPLHITGYVLHPLWTGNGQEITHEMNIGWMTTIMRYANGNDALRSVLIDEFYAYRKQMGDMFHLPMAKEYDKMQNPVKWWEIFGTSTPNLMKLAIRVLSQGISASPCERNWSTFSLIHTKRRNRLSPTHVEKLVYCHTNLRLLKKIKERAYAPLEITMAMIDEEEDEERLLKLQREQEMMQNEENDVLSSVIAHLEDNTQDEDDIYNFDDIDGHESLDET